MPRVLIASLVVATSAASACDCGQGSAGADGGPDADRSDAPSRPPGDPKVGIDVGLQLDPDGNLDIKAERARSTGAGWVRVNFVLGPHSSPDDPDWQADFDAIVDAYRAEGLEVYGLIGGEAVPSDAPVGSDEWLDSYAVSFVAIVDHFKDRVRVFESFNEPNNWVAENTPALTPERFAEVLARLYLETRVFNGHANDPAWQVSLVSGALFSFDLTDSSDYLEQVYSHGRFAGSWDFVCSQAGSFPLDGLGYHVYVREEPDSGADEVLAALGSNVDAVEAVMEAHEAACPTAEPKQLWVSEVGWNAEFTGEDVQARNVDVLFDAYREHSEIALFIWFTLDDFPDGPYGLHRLDGTPRPSYDAFRQNTAAAR
jgi:hypothetical protein